MKVKCDNCNGTGLEEVHSSDSQSTNLEYEVVGQDDCRICGGTGMMHESVSRGYISPEESAIMEYNREPEINPDR